jgi:hypothetical protein
MGMVFSMPQVAVYYHFNLTDLFSLLIRSVLPKYMIIHCLLCWLFRRYFPSNGKQRVYELLEDPSRMRH